MQSPLYDKVMYRLVKALIHLGETELAEFAMAGHNVSLMTSEALRQQLHENLR